MLKNETGRAAECEAARAPSLLFPTRGEIPPEKRVEPVQRVERWEDAITSNKNVLTIHKRERAESKLAANILKTLFCSFCSWFLHFFMAAFRLHAFLPSFFVRTPPAHDPQFFPGNGGAGGGSCTLSRYEAGRKGRKEEGNAREDGVATAAVLAARRAYLGPFAAKLHLTSSKGPGFFQGKNALSAK